MMGDVTAPAGPTVHGDLVGSCPLCRLVGCDAFQEGYPGCTGCGRHHVAPVGDPCPAKPWVFGVEATRGRYPDDPPELLAGPT